MHYGSVRQLKDIHSKVSIHSCTFVKYVFVYMSIYK